MTLASDDQYAHLRANAAAQKRATVNRLSKAITQLEAEGRPVNTFTIKEVSGMDYMAYYRNRDAFQIFQEHSTHLRKERAQEQAKHQTASRGRSRKTEQGQAASHTIKVSPLRANSSASCKAGRSETAPDICSMKILWHPASVSASRCKARFWSRVETRA